jgi:hypothetical protein
MPGQNGLFLHEEILLLALRDQAGTFASGTQYSFGMGGAILAELLLDERIRVVTPKKTPLAEVAGFNRVGDPVIDECLQKVRDAKKRASLQTWVSRFANIKDLRHRVARRLAQRGILRVDQDKVLLIFNRTIYPEVDPGPERRILERLRNAIFGGVTDIDPRTVTLVALAHHTGLLSANFDKKELKERKDRIQRVINGDLSARATKAALDAMQAAVMVAVIMPTIITSSAIHH